MDFSQDVSLLNFGLSSKLKLNVPCRAITRSVVSPLTSSGRSTTSLGNTPLSWLHTLGSPHMFWCLGMFFWLPAPDPLNSRVPWVKVPSTCGLPEGDALSVYAMVQLNLAWHCYMQAFAPQVRSLSFVDNLAVVASQPDLLTAGLVIKSTFWLTATCKPCT